MTTEGPDVEVASLATELRVRGLRATPGRIAMLRILRGVTVAASHDDFVRKMPRRLANRRIDAVTVFRTLGKFVEVGLARRIDVGDRTWRYLPAARASAHLSGSEIRGGGSS